MGLISRVSSRTYRFTKKIKNQTKNTTPLLLKVSYNKTGRFNQARAFEGKEDLKHEVLIHTWRDATLRELIRDIIAKSNDNEIGALGTEYLWGAVFRHVQDGRYDIRRIGSTKNGISLGDDRLQPLQDKRFVVGDRIDIAVTLPRVLTYERKEVKKAEEEKKEGSKSRSRSRSPAGRNRSHSASSNESN